MNQVAVRQDDTLVDLENTQKMCSHLMKTPHYAKMGDVGVFAIVQKAKSVGLNPLDALNGAMYFINGKVELTANTMNYLIRAAGHSIVKDEKSNHQICILRGKRVDNGDTWTATFSIDDAKRAGIYRNNWEKYPEDYLFARALTRLARQLFPDVIKGCYVEGEVSDRTFDSETIKAQESPKAETITNELAADLYANLMQCSPEYQQEISAFCLKIGISENLEGLPVQWSERLARAIDKKRQEYLEFIAQSESIEVEA